LRFFQEPALSAVEGAAVNTDWNNSLKPLEPRDEIPSWNKGIRRKQETVIPVPAIGAAKTLQVGDMAKPIASAVSLPPFQKNGRTGHPRFCIGKRDQTHEKGLPPAQPPVLLPPLKKPKTGHPEILNVDWKSRA